MAAIAVKTLQMLSAFGARANSIALRFGGLPAIRERALASAVFAGIFAFGIASIDYLITGGPDWNPGALGQAYAMEMTAPAPRLTAFVSAEPPSGEAPRLEAVEEEVDYSIPTEVLLGGPEGDWAQGVYAYPPYAGKDYAEPAAAFPDAPIGAPPEKLKPGVSETASLW